MSVQAIEEHITMTN